LNIFVQAIDTEAAPEIHRIRITLASKNVKSVETVCNVFKDNALKKEIVVHGPVRMPTKHLKLMVRKSPCGEGTNSYDKLQMHIHKRVLELFCAQDVVRQIANIQMEAGVSVEVTVLPYYKNITTTTRRKN
jgi:small subunit ribosomal protein S20e